MTQAQMLQQQEAMLKKQQQELAAQQAVDAYAPPGRRTITLSELFGEKLPPMSNQRQQAQQAMPSAWQSVYFSLYT